MSASVQVQLRTLENALSGRLERKAILEAEISRQEAAISAAVEEAAENPVGPSPFLKGRPGYEARQRLHKAQGELEELDTLLPAMLERKARLTADESRQRLDEAIVTIKTHHVQMRDAVVEAAALLESLVRGPWRKFADAFGEYSILARAGAGVAGEALAADPAATAKWQQACVLPFEPFPANAADFADSILAAMVDPQSDFGSGGNENRLLRELVSDCRGVGLYAVSNNDVIRYTRGTPLGAHLEALRNVLAPPPAPVVEVADADRERAEERERLRVAEVEHQFSKLPLRYRQMRGVPQAERWGREEPLHEPTEAGREPARPASRDTGGLDGPLSGAELEAIRRADLEDELAAPRSGG
jgi:hypothetical protein